MTPGPTPDDRSPADLAALVGDVDAVVWERDGATGRFTFVSGGAARLLGHPAGRWTDEPDFWRDEILHPEDRDRVLAERAAAAGRDHTLVYRARAADGRVLWLRESARAAGDRLRGVTVDVTREQEGEARQAEMARILARVSDGFVALDRDWRFEYVNPQAASLLGRTAAELRGANLWDAFPAAPGTAFWTGLHRARATGVPVHFRERYAPLGRWFDVDAYPSAEGLSVSFRDATESQLAHEALARSQAHLVLALESGRMGTWEWDIQADRVLWSPQEERLYGIPEGSFEGTREAYARAIHPDDREAAWRAVQTALDARAPTHHVLHRIVRPDGEVRWLDSHGRFLYDADGTPLRLVGVSTDVTERREETSLVETLQRIGALVASELELDRIVQAVTDEATRLTGAQFGAFFYNVLNDAGESYMLYTISGVPREAFARFPMPRNTAVFSPTFHGEGVVRSDDITRDPRYGRSAPYHGMPEGHLPVTSYLAVPVRSHDGEVIGGLFFGHEAAGVFTARHEQLAEGIAGWAALAMDNARLFQAQGAARAAAEHARTELQRIFEQAPAAISVTHGPEHVMVSQNAMARELVGGRDTVGMRLADAFPELAEQGFLGLQDRVLATGEPYVGHEVRMRLDRDGDGRPEDAYFHFVYQPLHDAAGAVYGIMTHAVEVTDQVRARREVERRADELLRLTRALEESNRELDQFAYVTSHDLKAPLRGIASLAQFVEEDLGDRIDGEPRANLTLLKGRVHRMEALIDGILAYSRAGRVRTGPEPVDTGALALDAAELLAGPAGAVRVAEGMPVVRAERVPLQQVFLNLIGNALKHGGAEPRVDVTWRDADSHWQFAVADDGPGIAPEYHERIWGLFQTLQPRDRVEGAGIGLSVVRKIVESRGGRTWVESGPGRGAVFFFTVPKEPVEAP